MGADILNGCGHITVLHPWKSARTARRLDSKRPDLQSFCPVRETGRGKLGYIGEKERWASQRRRRDSPKRSEMIRNEWNRRARRGDTKRKKEATRNRAPRTTSRTRREP